MRKPTYEVITLEKLNVRTIYQVFVDAFTDYFVKFDNRFEVHIERWLSAGVDFSLSYGVKSDGVLVAFLLHAPKDKMVMNLATGVRREFQGQGLTSLMYGRILKELPGKGFSRMQLEVITENHRAIQAYEKVGFKKVRQLLSWKGELMRTNPQSGQHKILNVNLTHEHEMLITYPFAFEQSNSVVMRRSGELELHELRDEKELIAFSVWNPWKMNLVQLGGKDAKSLTTLLYHMKLSEKHLGMINVDNRNDLVISVLKDNGLVNFLSQYEMERDL